MFKCLSPLFFLAFVATAQAQPPSGPLFDPQGRLIPYDPPSEVDAAPQPVTPKAKPAAKKKSKAKASAKKSSKKGGKKAAKKSKSSKSSKPAAKSKQSAKKKAK